MDTEFITKRMLELKLDREALMAALGVSDSSVRNILRGLVPKRPVLKLLAQALGCTEEKLLTPQTRRTLLAKAV